MRRLLQFLRKVIKFRTYLFQDKLLILKAFFITGIMRILLILVPFKILKKYVGKYDEESSFNIDNINSGRIEKIGLAVTKISRHTPWDSKCFVQALTAQRLLYDSGFESTLYLGVSKSLNKGVLDAHAWIRCGNIYVTGGNGEKFSIVAKFKNNIKGEYYEKIFYSVYGLIVRSEVELSELIEINKDEIREIHNKTDVNITYNEIPKYVMEEINSKNGCSYSFNESWFYIHHVAIYRICNGKDIYIKHIGGETQEIKTFLLGGAFICLLFQRKTIAIHGGSILVDDGGIIVTGACGAGKSTLTSALRKIGYKYLADDLSVIGINSYGKLEVKPAYPQQKLCRDAAVKLGYNINELVRIDEGRDKFAVPARNDFINSSKELKAIFEINADDSVKNIKIEEIKGIKKLNSIIDNLYESDIAKCYGLDLFMNMLLKIAKNIPYYKLIRPKDLFTVNDQINLITSIL